MSLSSSLQKLAAYRTNNSRASFETFQHGAALLKAGTAPTGDDGEGSEAFGVDCADVWAGWAFLEQLALAAIDLDRLEIADVRPLFLWKLTSKQSAD